MSATHDVFFSYRRRDLARARPLLSALEASGLRVWRDQTDLPDNGAITPGIRQGLAGSKALIAFFGLEYPLSRPCLQEITTAWVAAELMAEAPFRRVLVINPEESLDHLPAVLREQQSMGWARDPAGYAALAAKICSHVNTLEDTLGRAASLVMPAYFGMAPLESPAFVGRAREMWDLHGRLIANRMSITTGVVGQAVAQIRGLGGSGKSLLAREYAVRFGPAYPGGIFWLNAHGNDDTKGTVDENAREALRQSQIRDFAARVGIHVEGLTPPEAEGALWRRLAQDGRPCLWIVDDVPSGLEKYDVEKRWNAQWSGASTLLTTRSMEYGAIGSQLDLEVLSDAEAFQLITGHSNPHGGQETEAARQVCHELGNHPLAIAVAGSYLAKGAESYGEYLQDLRNPKQDAVEFGSELRESLPTGHDRSISGTLLKSIRLLGEEGMDFLRLASVLAVSPIPVSLLKAALESIESETPARVRLLRALDQVDSLGLCAKAGDDARSVHTLVSRTVRYHVGQTPRNGSFRAAAARALSECLKNVADVRKHSELSRELTHARQILLPGISTIEEAAVGILVATHDHERGDFVGAQKAFEEVLEARERLLGGTHPDTLAARSGFAETLRDQGQWEVALGIFEQVLEIRRQSLGERHADTLTSMANVAGAIYNLGGAEKAIKLLQSVLQARREIFGKEHPDSLHVQLNLAEILSEQGNLDESERLEEDALEISRRILGDDAPRTLLAKYCLAKSLVKRNDYNAAQKLLEQVLDVAHRLSLDEHPDILGVRHTLSEVKRGQGDLDEARKLLEQLLASMRIRLGEDHPESLLVQGEIAGIMSQQGDLAGAAKLQQDALDAARRRWGLEHEATSVAAWNLIAMLAGDPAAMDSVLAENLVWLVARDDATLTAGQRKIKRILLDVSRSG
jgi:tetratricopeptide (TPR) repeat protein